MCGKFASIPAFLVHGLNLECSVPVSPFQNSESKPWSIINDNILYNSIKMYKGIVSLCHFCALILDVYICKAIGDMYTRNFFH